MYCVHMQKKWVWWSKSKAFYNLFYDKLISQLDNVDVVFDMNKWHLAVQMSQVSCGKALQKCMLLYL